MKVVVFAKRIPLLGKEGWRDSADVGYYRDMVTIIRDRIQTMMKNGMTLEQIKAARPTRDYDPRYGANGATERFIESVYNSLQQQAGAAK